MRAMLTFLAMSSALVAGTPAGAPGPGDCPQPRFTGQAPVEYRMMKNPMDAMRPDLTTAARLYAGESAGSGVDCAACHGRTGNGKGPRAGQFDPPPRNFACANTVDGVADGQLFWIIRHGSPGTGMPPHRMLADDQVWMLVSYLRALVR